MEHKTLVDPPRFHLDELIPGAPHVQPIEVVFERATVAPADMPGALKSAPMLEIWTQNRVYYVDATMTCVAVYSRKTAAPESHTAIGARLTGGQRKYDKTVHVSRPYPVPGTEAVFQRDGSSRPAGVTSKVERVVMRITVTSVVTNSTDPWDDVTSALLLPEHLR